MENLSPFVGTIWSILPPIIAIGLALLTKEVYFSLIVGIFAGAMFFTSGNIMTAFETMFNIMAVKVGDNFNIVIFLVLLGMIVALVSKSGASGAYGAWASKSIKTKKGATLATIALGCLIFVDDYFNCLTVGTVMSPVTDRHYIKRAKLAYLIDA
ncbi:MAG: Na+/H+ antiporter NhaC family protein, partial [Clostridia bacterium]|nr:Na+/H+ antiporter NhaC family protein [Clostridia bacterium]